MQGLLGVGDVHVMTVVSSQDAVASYAEHSKEKESKLIKLSYKCAQISEARVDQHQTALGTHGPNK